MTNRNSARPSALVVDDDAAIREALVEILDEAGFATTDFEYGHPALAALGKERFDLLLIDQWLPDINGMQICAAANERYGDAAVVMLITADPRIERHISALNLCADDVVRKPFDVDLLLARIEAKRRWKRTTAA